ncbi:hypothetical protein PSENEW3_00005638 [Picochlorum sp. SENEW3]|nr:hypothetical protein PSENEW3_00005638 [Picochlorum sp. SENEW3]
MLMNRSYKTVLLLAVCAFFGGKLQVNARPNGAEASAEDERLLLAVRKPSIVNSTLSSLTVGFYSGPNLKKVDFTAACVNQFAPFDCQNPALNSSSTPVIGVIPKTQSLVEATVDGLALNATYDCYITVTSGKVTKCVGPFTGSTRIPEGGAVSYSLLYGLDVAFFDTALQKQVCENLLSLVPLGTCTVSSVADGARAPNQPAIVSGSVAYDSYLKGKSLVEDLLGGSNSTLTALADEIVSNSSQVSVLSASLQPIDSTPQAGTPNFVSVENIEATSAEISWLDGKIGNPEETYTVTCVDSLVSTCSDPGMNVTDIPRGNETVVINGLSSNTTYSCWVKAVNSQGSVCSSGPVQFTTKPLCTSIPGAAINVSPQAQSCFISSGHYQGGGRMFRDGSTPPTCGNTPKPYPGNFNTGTTMDVVVFNGYAPPPGTCVTVTVNGGTCGFSSFLSLWSGKFPIVTQTWPSTGTVGDAVFQNDPGSSGSLMTASFTMPSGTGAISIVLSTTSGTSSCLYGDIQITYS